MLLPAPSPWLHYSFHGHCWHFGYTLPARLLLWQEFAHLGSPIPLLHLPVLKGFRRRLPAGLKKAVKGFKLVGAGGKGTALNMDFCAIAIIVTHVPRDQGQPHIPVTDGAEQGRSGAAG